MLFASTPPYDEVDFEIEDYEEKWRSGDENHTPPLCLTVQPADGSAVTSSGPIAT
jgi:hypothetical protein